GQSLAQDGDLTYRKEDLVRVWREFPTGPSGVFLKKGQVVTGVSLGWRPPFLRLTGKPDPDPDRLFFGKSFIYPAVAAPFVKVFGTNGFLVLHAILLSLVVLCAYLFLHARAQPTPSALLAAGFVVASVVPVYFVWITAELFNFALVFLAYFCWLYKEVAVRERSPRGTGWLFCGRSDVVAAALLGIATFSKPSNAIMFLPIPIWGLVGRKVRRAPLVSTIVFLLVTGGLFGINVAISGDWNYQGGARDTYYDEFPFQTATPTHPLGLTRSREGMLTGIVFSRRVFASNLRHNLEYFFVGRYAGLLPYFFPGAFAMIALLIAPRRRPAWQWIALGAALAQGLLFVVATPYTWNGGGVGNRYFMSAYGAMLFAMPPIDSIAAAFVPWVLGGLFVAPMVLNPFVASYRPGSNAKSGPLRLLPVELTLVNDLPVNTESDRAHIWYGDLGKGDPGFLVYFLDDNAYGREADRSFWTRGRSRAEFIIKTDRPIRRAIFNVSAGPVPDDVSIRIGGREQEFHLDAGQTQEIAIMMPAGVPYEKETHALVWTASVACRNGFTPIFFDPASTDVRYLGVRVKPMLEVQPQ
ncbi:MAG: hypothetical protein ACRD1V_13775, partial [Vicinamibacterales bacterium]